MIKISESAVHQFKKILEEQNLTAGGIRVGVRGDGNCAMNFYLGIQKEPLEGDRRFKIRGINVFMDQLSIEKLDSVELDYLENPLKNGFVFREIDSGEEDQPKKCRL